MDGGEEEARKKIRFFLCGRRRRGEDLVLGMYPKKRAPAARPMPNRDSLGPILGPMMRWAARAAALDAEKKNEEKLLSHLILSSFIY